MRCTCFSPLSQTLPTKPVSAGARNGSIIHCLSDGYYRHPIAAAVTSFLAMALKAGQPVTLFNILTVTIPATLIGVFLAAIWSLNRGKDLDKGPRIPGADEGSGISRKLEESANPVE